MKIYNKTNRDILQGKGLKPIPYDRSPHKLEIRFNCPIDNIKGSKREFERSFTYIVSDEPKQDVLIKCVDKRVTGEFEKEVYISECFGNNITITTDMDKAQKYRKDEAEFFCAKWNKFTNAETFVVTNLLSGESPEVKLGKLLKEKNITLCTAESITGGLIAEKITSVPGASKYFVGGFCTYCNAMKKKILSVPDEVIKMYTEISAPCAEYMALGAVEVAGCDCAVSVTGLGGGSDVGGVSEDGRKIAEGDGTVFFAVALHGQIVFEGGRHYKGTRDEIRNLSANDCINAVIEIVKQI